MCGGFRAIAVVQNQDDAKQALRLVMRSRNLFGQKRSDTASTMVRPAPQFSTQSFLNANRSMLQVNAFGRVGAYEEMCAAIIQ